VDGGMAEFVKLPVNSLLKLPPGLPPVRGAMVEPLAVAIHVLRTRRPFAMNSALVKTTRIWECGPYFEKSFGVAFARERQFGLKFLF
jgi:threonine dehydrogenase-like Zn-dependent dehydrogenase